MILMTTTTSNLWVSQLHPNQNRREKQNLLGHKIGFFFLKPNSRTTVLSLTHYNNSCPNNSRTSFSLTTTIDHQHIDYNAEIWRFCQVANLKKAMELLCSSEPTSNIESRTYCSILQLCAELKSLHNGQKVHSLICTNGVEIDANLGSKLVFMYASCGDLKEGRTVFDVICNEKVFLWNLLMNEYAKNGDFAQSIYLYKRMQVLGVEANSYTFSCIFKCFAAIGSVMGGEQAHRYMLRLGFGSYNTVVNSVIAFYFKCGRVESARKLFDELSNRDVISWNTMISGYLANGLAEKGLEIFNKMLKSGVGIDSATIVSVLASCADVGNLSLVRALHSYATRMSFNEKITVNNTLLDVYSKCGDLDGAVRVFKSMGKRNVVSWTSMIAGYVREGLSDKAVEVFVEMRKAGVNPDTFTVTSILHACACNGSLEKGKEVHNYVRVNNMQSNLAVSNALMDMYAKCGSMGDSHSVFSQMPAKDIVSWNTMIGGYSKNSLPNEALNLFVEMQCELKPDNVTMTCILPACASLGALDRGREIHGHILRNGFSDRYVVNALVDMYVKCGALTLAQLLFNMILVKDLVSWTVMIAGYGMHGFGSNAIATFKRMRREGIEPDEVSFTSILYACSHSGLLDEGWRFYHIMKNDCKIKARLEHYACMVDLLSRAGKLSEAYKFIEMMPVKPDATIWGALLCGCRTYHDVELAERVAENVFELEPENTGYYVLLANIYAEAVKWEDVKRLRERIGRRGLKKKPGCSWIEIKGEVHIFVSGDNAHSQVRNIDALLKKLRTQMKREGYLPKTRYALVNADEMEKEVALCGHSEKLAMALGIMSLPPGKTVRVTKNLRVCGDCHEMAKFMSKTVGREIVLRDSNRFHHFKDGSCSCRGYW